jgi:peroxiredoxin
MKWRGISTDSAEQAVAFRPLHERLAEVRAGIEQYVLLESRQINERAIAGVRESGLVEQALAVGETAPEFTLLDQIDDRVSSHALLERGPLIVSFFRGRWCPFCMMELEAWRDVAPEVEAAGASLVAISPQTVRHNAFCASQHKLRFPVLADPGLAVAREFGIVYPVSDEQRALFKRVFINLPHLNGDDSWQLPLPATFVLGTGGKVLYALVDADYRRRAEPEEVLKVLTG